jgi:3-(methylthio)propionyl---CoA ligase
VLGLMQQQRLLLSSIIQHAARWHPTGEIVSRMSETSVHRTNYATIERRSRRLANVLRRLGVNPGDRVATMAWNNYRHLELYWAISGTGAVCHTINPRLTQGDISYIMTHAGDTVLFADLSFVLLIAELGASIAACVRHIVLLAATAFTHFTHETPLANQLKCRFPDPV